MQHQRLDAIPEVDDLVRVDVVANRQFAGRDHPFGLEADVQQDLVLVDLDDGPGHDVAVLELHNGAGDSVLERRAIQVVGDHLAGLVLAGLVKRPHLGLDLGAGRCGGVGGGRRLGHLMVAFFPGRSTPRKGLWGDASSKPFAATPFYTVAVTRNSW